MLNWFSRKDLPTANIDELRNRAVATWIKTFPVDERLQEFLTSVPASCREDIQASAKGIFSAASEYLEDAAKTGVVKLDEFYPALEAHLLGKFPWMREAAFAALRSYTGWFAWHEGYSANAK